MVFRLFLSLLLLLASSCYRSRYPLLPTNVQPGVYKIAYPGGSGTAWVVSKHYAITAGHVCEQFESTYVLLGTVERYPVERVAWEYGTGERDLCLLYSRADLGSGLIVADKMPRKGEAVSYIGYPRGEYIEADGVFLGDIDGDREYNNAAFSAPCAPGASGSPVYTTGGVWGVLVRVRTDGTSGNPDGWIHDGTDGCVAIPLAPLSDFLRRHDVPYNQPPFLDDI